MRKLEAMLNKLDRQFKKYRQHALCGFGKGRGWAFAWADYRFGSQYEIDFKPAAEHEQTADNWNPNNWKDETTGVFDGCSAYQQLLDAIRSWGMEYAQGCHGKWSPEKRSIWFKRQWTNFVNKFSRDIPKKLEGVFADG